MIPDVKELARLVQGMRDADGNRPWYVTELTCGNPSTVADAAAKLLKTAVLAGAFTDYIHSDAQMFTTVSPRRVRYTISFEVPIDGVPVTVGTSPRNLLGHFDPKSTAVAAAVDLLAGFTVSMITARHLLYAAIGKTPGGEKQPADDSPKTPHGAVTYVVVYDDAEHEESVVCVTGARDIAAADEALAEAVAELLAGWDRVPEDLGPERVFLPAGADERTASPLAYIVHAHPGRPTALPHGRYERADRYFLVDARDPRRVLERQLAPAAKAAS